MHGIKAQRAAAQRPSAPPGGRFGDVSLRVQLRAGSRHKVQTTAVLRPPDGLALRGSVQHSELPLSFFFTSRRHNIGMAQKRTEPTLPLFQSPDPAIRDFRAANSAAASNRRNKSMPSYLADHRERLRERFMQGGADAMPDYELLELILFRAIPRQDVKPLARCLIEHFGDFNRVLSATPARLTEIEGVGQAVVIELKLVEAASRRLARAKVMNRQVLSGWQKLLDYCHTAMAHRETEHFRVLFLDRKNALIADEEQARGTVDHVPVYPREILRRALELNSSALILVHNHPSGDPTPSEADISMTAQIVRAADCMGITIHDHLVIGQSRELSFRAEGLLT